MDEQFMDFHQFSFMVNPALKKILFSAGSLPGIDNGELKNFARNFCSNEELFDKELPSVEEATTVLRDKQTYYQVKDRSGIPVQLALQGTTVSLEHIEDPCMFYVVKLKSGETELAKKEMQEIFKNEYESFIHTAAHDLDSPARKISVLVERLLARVENSDDEHVKQYSDRITHSVGELKSLIDGLSMLSLCILENRKYSQCDFGTIVQQVVKDLNELITVKNATVYFADLPSIQGDIVQYRQLFRCILENSVKFCRESIPPVITIEHTMLDGNGKSSFHLPQQKEYHSITISDNGIGFHPDHAERIFRPFERLNGKSRFPGSGLGLTICKRIIENHSGIVFADNYASGGCRITFILPQIQD